MVWWHALGGIGIILAASVCWPSIYGGAWSPSKMGLVRKMLDMAELKADETLIDLGAGDGRIIFTAAREYGAKAIGVEIEPLRQQYCKTMAATLGLSDRVSVVRTDFFQMDMSQADVVSFYLSQAAADRLAPKFASELKAGARVVSNRRPLPGWEPERVDRIGRIYMYRKK